MFFFSLIGTLGLLGVYWLILDPVYGSISIISLIIPIFTVSLVTTIIEMLSPRHTDNLLIPIAAIVTVVILFYLGFYTYPIGLLHLTSFP